jgi:hypothetical protein
MCPKVDRQARDLAIAYRIYPRVAKPAVALPFSDDKLRLSEICLRSFKESLGGLRVLSAYVSWVERYDPSEGQYHSYYYVVVKPGDLSSQNVLH